MIVLSWMILIAGHFNYNQQITNLSQIVIMRAHYCYEVLIFMIAFKCSSSENKKELALEEGLMKIELLGTTIAFFESVCS